MTEGFEFRDVRLEEAEQATQIEQICFPPNEACSPERMTERIYQAAEVFMVMVDKSTGRLAGLINGIATNEKSFRDEFFTDISLYDRAGKNIMILGVDVLPEYRNQGLARAMMEEYCIREHAKGREKLYLTCLEGKVAMYQKFGFDDLGAANSTWGGEEWHEMVKSI